MENLLGFDYPKWDDKYSFLDVSKIANIFYKRTKYSNPLTLEKDVLKINYNNNFQIDYCVFRVDKFIGEWIIIMQ